MRYTGTPFNGMLGVVTSITDPSIHVLWDGEDEARSLPKEAEGDVELAYAITCHKAQGSSADAVVVLVEDTPLVTREWLYTAVTRGKALVLLVAGGESLKRAVQRRTIRTTGFVLQTRAVKTIIWYGRTRSERTAAIAGMQT